MVLLPLSYLFVVKKEDAWKILNLQRKEASIIVICTAIVLGIMRFSIIPKLILLYSNIGTEIPASFQLLLIILPFLIIGAFIAGLYLWFAKPNYERVEMLASKFPDGQVIKIRELLDFRYLIYPALFCIVTIGYTAYILVSSIYSMTSQL